MSCSVEILLPSLMRSAIVVAMVNLTPQQDDMEHEGRTPTVGRPATMYLRSFWITQEPSHLAGRILDTVSEWYNGLSLLDKA